MPASDPRAALPPKPLPSTRAGEIYLLTSRSKPSELIRRLQRRRFFFGSRGSRVFIAEEAAESKAMNAPRPPQGFLSSVVVALCLVLNQISKHNMRSYKNVLMPAGGIEPPQCQWYSVRRKVLLGQKKKKIQIQTSLYITDTSDRQWKRAQGTIEAKNGKIIPSPTLDLSNMELEEKKTCRIDIFCHT